MAEKISKRSQQRSRVQSGPLSQRTVKPATPSKVGRNDGRAVFKVAQDPSPKLVFKEVNGDLFECPGTCSLAHCVSEDLAMGKGVAKLFKEKFGGVSVLRAQGVSESGRGWILLTC